MTALLDPVLSAGYDGTLGALLPDPTETRRLVEVLAKAASGPDRSGGIGFAPSMSTDDSEPGDDHQARSAAAAWLDKAAGPHAMELATYLERTGRDLAAALRPVRWIPGPQPPWVLALVTFLRAQPAPGEPDQVSTSGARAAAALIRPPQSITVTEPARLELARTLELRLAEATQAAAPASTRAQWLDRFEQLPGLAYAVGVTCAQWSAAAEEMFDRLAADWSLLRERIFHGTDPGAVVAIRADAGDRHAGGRSVALLDFADGQSVVYKSKDLRHVAGFQRLLARLNEHGASHGDDPDGRGHLRTRRVVVREGYGWEERVATQPCADSEGFARFYYRLGRLARLMQLVAGRDMWADNLLAAGEHPVVIDLECLLFARPRPLPGLQLDSSATHHLDETVVATSMLCQPWSSPLDSPVLDVGCLSRASDVLRPDGTPLLPLPPYRPRTAAGPADPWQYAEQVIDGYRSMQATLRSLQPALLAPDGPLAELRNAPVRHIRRNTWDCYRLIRISVAAPALAGGVERETVLAGLMRSVFTVADASRTDLIEMVLSEITALRQLDIPLLASRPDSQLVFDPHGRPLGRHFAVAAFDQLQDRVRDLDNFDLDGHVSILRACLDAALDGSQTRPPGASTRAARAGTVPTADELIDAAAEIGWSLMAAQHDSGDWISQTWHPVTGLRTVEVVGADLAAGTTGFAVLLAELAAVTGESRFGQASLDTLDAATRLAHALSSGPPHQRIAGAAYVPGGLAGTGAVLHALARVGDRLAEPSLLAAAGELVAQLAQGVATARGPRLPFADLPTGIAGLLLNLMRLHQTWPGAPDLAALISTARQLLPVCCAEGKAGDQVGDPRYAARAARVVPAGADSVAMTRARLAACVDVSVPVHAHRFSGRSHGSALAWRDTTLSDPSLAAPPPIRSLRRPDQTSGSQLVRTLGLAMTDADRVAVLPHAGELLRRRARSGSWFSDRITDDRVQLGLLDGLGAIALALLQVARSDVRPLTTLR